MAFALCLLGGALRVDDTVTSPPVTAHLLAAVSSGLLPVRQRAPVAIVIATTLCGVLVAPMGLLSTPLVVAPAAISAYSLAVRTERPVTPAVLLPAAALLVAVPPFFETDLSWADTGRLATVAATPLVSAVFGRSTRHRRAYLTIMEDRARLAEETRDDEARRRVAGERLRIARELHDLVAHQITLANAQATVAAHLFATRPEQARTSLDELVGTTRHALDELRAAVGLLRQPEDTSALTEPAPGLSQVPELLSTFHRAGLAVSMHEDGTARPLPPAVDLTAYRVIQEALTNVAKHAATGSAEVRLAWNRDHVIIAVTDDGGGSREPQERPPGYGLIGMRERVTAVGGSLSADVRPQGGFLVSAHLPLPAAGNPARRTDGATDGEGR
ncbi:sensor histidine kinase [Umezawaea beigongshangensis]|uniref:sensor histidine kinase n=1 Tax=Umezawaea beigongshangensis TaxID=2780383 RepID=UPI0018F19FCC|nr:sensor histidine kinase [Umezawaea beigongshangensis]